MKKRIAVFGAGWGSEILLQFMNGIKDAISTENADIFLFLCFPLLTDELSSTKGELNIFSLPVLKNFDGAIIFGNSIDFDEVFDSINASCKEAGIPTVSCGRRPDYGYFISPENKKGMEELCKHLCNEHGFKDVFYIAGSRNNPDSNLRLDAIKSVFKEYDPDNIYYTNWDLTAAASCINEFVDSGKKLPDVFMCANDGLAIFAANELMTRGYRIPEDVCVTGFDDTYSSSVFNPTLTSVSQNLYELGRESLKLVLNHKENDPYADVLIPCTIKKRESTGCKKSNDEANAARADIGHRIFIDRLISNNFDTKLNYLDAQLLSGKEFLDIYNSLSGFYSMNSGFEKGNMHILLDPDYENSVYDEGVILRENGYPDYMFDIFSMNDGKISFNPYFETEKLVPNIENDTEGNHIYILSPLHDGDITMGYYVFRDIIDEIDRNNNLVRYEQRLNSIFIKYRKNLLANFLNNKLMIINETDPMTGVKNRNAYDVYITGINKAIVNKNSNDFSIVIFDINDLKKVNDEYGHEYGDAYIINSCKLLCNVFKHSPVFRIGGDEFVTFLKGDDYSIRNTLLNELQERLNGIENSTAEKWDRVSVAYGMGDFDPKIDLSVSDVFKRADVLMYENKKEYKEKLKG